MNWITVHCGKIRDFTKLEIGYPKTAEAFTIFSESNNFFDSDGRQGSCSELINDVVIMSMIEKIGKSSTTY